MIHQIKLKESIEDNKSSQKLKGVGVGERKCNWKKQSPFGGATYMSIIVWGPCMGRVLQHNPQLTRVVSNLFEENGNVQKSADEVKYVRLYSQAFNLLDKSYQL